MIVLIRLFVQIYLRKNVTGQAQEHWLLNPSQYWEGINECMMFIMWYGDVIRLNEWWCWLVYSSKYTWESMYLGNKKNIDYLTGVNIKNKSMNVSFFYWIRWRYFQTQWMIMLISLFIWIYLKRLAFQKAQEHWLLNISQYWEWINESMTNLHKMDLSSDLMNNAVD